jgi:hypothetical protein
MKKMLITIQDLLSPHRGERGRVRDQIIPSPLEGEGRVRDQIIPSPLG